MSYARGRWEPTSRHPGPRSDRRSGWAGDLLAVAILPPGSTCSRPGPRPTPRAVEDALDSGGRQVPRATWILARAGHGGEVDRAASASRARAPSSRIGCSCGNRARRCRGRHRGCVRGAGFFALGHQLDHLDARPVWIRRHLLDLATASAAQGHLDLSGQRGRVCDRYGSHPRHLLVGYLIQLTDAGAVAARGRHLDGARRSHRGIPPFRCFPSTCPGQGPGASGCFGSPRSRRRSPCTPSS